MNQNAALRSSISLSKKLENSVELIASIILVAFLCVAFVGFQPLSPIEVAELSDAAGGDAIRQLAYVSVLGGLISITLLTGQLKVIKLITLAMVIAIGWCFLSSTWSAVPDISARRSGLMAVVFLTVFLVVALLGAEKSLVVFSKTLIALVVLSLIAGLVSPNAIHKINDPLAPDLAGNWRGIFPHKNIAGVACVAVIINCVYLRSEIGRKLSAFGLLSSFLLLYLSASKTSGAGVIISICAGYSMATISRYSYFRNAAVAVFPIIIIAVLFAVFASNGIEELLGDPKAFTGRVAIWNALFKVAETAPWTGVGYASIFGLSDGSPLMAIDPAIARIAHGHNGYIELYASVGIVGLVLALLGFVVSPFIKLIRMRGMNFNLQAALFSTMVMALIHNFTESSLMYRDRHMWIVLLFVVACIGLKSIDLKTASRP